MNNKLKVFQLFLVIIMFICFVLFLYNFITKESYLIPLIIMIISFIGVIIFSFFISKSNDEYHKMIKYENIDKIKEQAIINVDEKLKKDGKFDHITYIEKNKLVEDEIDKLNRK